MATYQGAYIYRNETALLEQNRRIMAERKPGDGPKGQGILAAHGTAAAARRHQRNGEPACEACAAAHRARSGSGLSRGDAQRLSWERRKAAAAERNVA